MVVLPSYIKGVIVGLLLSDAWLNMGNPGGQARLGLKQSLKHAGYLLSVFFMLAHYFKSYPKFGLAKLKGKVFPYLTISSRSLACFTELYYQFYVTLPGSTRVKIVPTDIFNMLTIQGLAH